MGPELNTPPAPLRILETVLYARDLAAIEIFYRHVLGLEPFTAAAGTYFIAAETKCC